MSEKGKGPILVCNLRKRCIVCVNKHYIYGVVLRGFFNKFFDTPFHQMKCELKSEPHDNTPLVTSPALLNQL